MFVEPSENSSGSFLYLLESSRYYWVGIWQLHIFSKEIILLYIAHLNHKPFSLSNIKQYGLEVILVLINVCTYTDLKSL